MKKRTWFKRSSLILSAVVSMAAPAGKLSKETKVPKGCKKSKSPLSSVADERYGDTSPPFDDDLQAQGRHHAAAHHHKTRATTADEVRRALPVGLHPLTPAIPVEEVRRALAADMPQEEVRRAEPSDRYTWKRDIGTTVFWIGEEPTQNNPVPNHASSWDQQWAKHYGGYDDPNPKARQGYLPAEFTPKQNPFYVALPYNDITQHGHKKDAHSVIPWFKQGFTSKWKSVCKGRWIAIRKGDRVCYAQWEDAGPFTTDDAEYVFGDARPKPNPNHNAGLDVSPAVRDFLGLDGSDVTNWKFVEFEEIPQGPWAKHGENNHFVLNRKAAEERTLAMTALAKRSPIIRRRTQAASAG